MHQHHIEQAEIMQQNLQRMVKNQNYFSCFIQSARPQEEPANPFQKKLFDKNLRRSTISCGHYGSTSSHHNQSSQQQQESHRLSSSRSNSLKFNQNNYISKQNQLQHPFINHINQPRIQTAHKVSLTQSRHSDPHKQQITQIINNFRLELDYLQEKLHNKMDQLNCNYDRSEEQKQREAGFMIESLQKIVGFMVENCVNLEDSVMYGSGDKNQQEEESYSSSSARDSSRRDIMRKEVYQIQEDSNQENMSFSNGNSNSDHHYRPTQRLSFSKQQNMMKKKRKIVGLIEKENNINSNNHLHYQQQNLPQTYFINNKLHSINQNNSSKPLSLKSQNQTTRQQINQSSSKPTKRAPSKSRNPKVTTNTHPQNINQNHYHSGKQTTSQNHNTQYHSSSSIPDTNHQAKSIYQTVLQERQMRLKMKKKIV